MYIVNVFFLYATCDVILHPGLHCSGAEGQEVVLVPSRLFRVLLFAVGFQRGIDLLSQRLHLTRVRQAFGV